MSRPLEPPRRPSLPVTFPALVAVIAGEAATLRLGWQVPWQGACALGAGLVALAVWSRGNALARLACAVGACCMAGLVAGAAADWSLARFSDALAGSPVTAWSLRVTGDPSLGDYGYRVRAQATCRGLPTGSVWLAWEEEPALGETITCVGRFKPNGDDEWGVSNRAQGIAGTVSVVRLASRTPATGAYGALMALRERAIEAMGPSTSEAGALVAASVCGYRAGMDASGLADLFSACGVSHLVAVSGGHLAIVSGVLDLLLEAQGAGPRLRSVLLVLVSGAFVLFCGAPVSAVRSWLMVIVAGGAAAAGRRAHGLSAVCLVGCALALLDPFVSGQLGFLLSVVSVVGLCVLTPYATYALRVASPRLPPRLMHIRLVRRASKGVSSLGDTLAATLVAQAVTAPVTVPTFGELSLVAPLANVVLGPLFSVIVSAGMVGAVLCAVPGVGSPMAQAPLLAARLCSSAAVFALRPLSGLPLASVPVSGWVLPLVLVCLVVGVYVLWPPLRHRYLLGGLAACGVAVVLVLVRWRFFAPARVVVLDVGQGDAILVQDGAAALLVDTGPDDAAAVALARQHVLHLDAVVLTHLHEDHTGGLDELVTALPCDHVLVADGVAGSMGAGLTSAVRDLTGQEASELSYGDTVKVGGFALRVISPVGEVSGEENEDSIELALAYQEGGRSLTALLTGDAEREVTGGAIARGDIGDIDLLKVGHHGSAVSITAEEAALLDPEVAVASAGEGNRYGHPTEECVETLEESGARFLCTKDVGDVDVRPGSRGPVVRYDGPHKS